MGWYLFSQEPQDEIWIHRRNDLSELLVMLQVKDDWRARSSAGVTVPLDGKAGVAQPIDISPMHQPPDGAEMA